MKTEKVTDLAYAKDNDFYWTEYFWLGFQWSPLEKYKTDMYYYYLNGEPAGYTTDDDFDADKNKFYIRVDSQYDDLERGHGYTLSVEPDFFVNQTYVKGEMVSLKFATKPNKVSKPTVKTTAGKAVVSWKKKIGSGYQVQISANSKFTQDKKSYKITSSQKASKTISGLKSGKKYYVRVRAYKTFGNTAYGSWSKTATFTCK